MHVCTTHFRLSFLGNFTIPVFAPFIAAFPVQFLVFHKILRCSGILSGCTSVRFCSVRALPRPDLAPRTGTFGAVCFFLGSASVLTARRGPVPAAGFINQTSAKIDFSSFSFRIPPLLLKITAGFSACCAGFPGFPTFFPRFRSAGRLWFTPMCPDMPWSGA